MAVHISGSKPSFVWDNVKIIKDECGCFMKEYTQDTNSWWDQGYTESINYICAEHRIRYLAREYAILIAKCDVIEFKLCKMFRMRNIGSICRGKISSVIEKCCDECEIGDTIKCLTDLKDKAMKIAKEIKRLNSGNIPWQIVEDKGMYCNRCKKGTRFVCRGCHMLSYRSDIPNKNERNHIHEKCSICDMKMAFFCSDCSTPLRKFEVTISKDLTLYYP